MNDYSDSYAGKGNKSDTQDLLIIPKQLQSFKFAYRYCENNNLTLNAKRLEQIALLKMSASVGRLGF